MFKIANESVRNSLIAMCDKVREDIEEKTDEVFRVLERDYHRTLLGEDNRDTLKDMPIWEQEMRMDIGKVIEESEKMFAGVVSGKEDVREAQLDFGSSDGQVVKVEENTASVA